MITSVAEKRGGNAEAKRIGRMTSEKRIDTNVTGKRETRKDWEMGSEKNSKSKISCERKDRATTFFYLQLHYVHILYEQCRRKNLRCGVYTPPPPSQHCWRQNDISSDFCPTVASRCP